VSEAANASSTQLLEGAEYPARHFVDGEAALEAARTFFLDGSRDPKFSWETPK
jgi:hypothetical protein